MGSLLMLLALCVVMALASFLAGALPLSMTLSQSQLRLISSIGVGILVGTSLIVIIPEGIEAVAMTSVGTHSHQVRALCAQQRSEVRWAAADAPTAMVRDTINKREILKENKRQETEPAQPETPQSTAPEDKEGHDEGGLPTFEIGFALILGFVLMFLIDRVPRHATDRMQAAPTTRHISLDDLGGASVAGEEEEEGFLGSLTPTPKQSRSLATTIGLVIHAAADGIAMGASATASNTKLGLIIFVAIMIHKAPAAFGLTSVLLKHGLSKRAARGHLIVFSLTAPFGALGTYLIISLLGGANMGDESGQWWTGLLLLFSAGTFLYVAMHAMQEETSTQGHDHHAGMNGYADDPQRKTSRPQMRDTLATVGGMLLPLLTQFGHSH